jgi:protein phosphatase PTC1
MEDAHVLDLDFYGQGWVFCGVYDGHRGRTAAMTAAEHLHTIFLHHLQKRQYPEEAMSAAYREVDHMLSGQRSGTTAVTAFIRERELLAANAGDSRCLLVRRQDSLQLSADHRLSNPEEKERVRQTGADIREPYIMVGASGLMPTRSLGDHDFASAGVIPEPFIHRKLINQDDLFLILACDGLFDVLSNQEVAEVVRSAQGPEEAALSLKREALEVRMSTDNLTVICLELQEEDQEPLG